MIFIDSTLNEGLQMTLGRLSASRVNSSTVRIELAVARDPTVNSGDNTSPLLSLTSHASGWEVSISGPLSVTGNLGVTGNIVVTGTVDGRDISADALRSDQHLAARNNPHVTTATQVGALVSVAGVSNAGGDIALAVSGALTIAPDDANNRITLGETHSARSDNPHNTTAAQVGALPLGGGALSGNLTVGGSLGIGAPTPVAKLQILHSEQDANGNALIIGPTNASNLRLGYHTNYSWVQSHGSRPLAINPLGNNVGIGTATPGARLDVIGGIRSNGQYLIKDIRVEIVDGDQGEGNVGGGWYRLGGDLNKGAGGKYIYLQILRAFD